MISQDTNIETSDHYFIASFRILLLIAFVLLLFLPFLSFFSLPPAPSFRGVRDVYRPPFSTRLQQYKVINEKKLSFEVTIHTLPHLKSGVLISTSNVHLKCIR